MPVIRINKSSDYTVMSNYHFKEKGMTLKAKGLLSLMLSLPENWDYSVAGLVTLSKDGKDSVMNALNELESFGYLVRTRLINKFGQFDGYDYNIYETPQSENPNEEKPNEGKPYAEKPNTDNPQQLNTNQSITKQSKTKESNTKIYTDILDHLNEKAGTAYRATSKATQTHINARLAETYTVEDFFTVIDKKCAEWRGTDMEKYLRPETLFGSKFESYLNAKIVPVKKYGANGVAIEENPVDDFDGIF